MAPFRFPRRKKSKASQDTLSVPSEKSAPYEPYFGEVRPSKKGAKSSRTKESLTLRENGEQVLLKFIKNRLGTQAEGLALRLMNKNPIKGGGGFSYQIHQSTEGMYFMRLVWVFFHPEQQENGASPHKEKRVSRLLLTGNDSILFSSTDPNN